MMKKTYLYGKLFVGAVTLSLVGMTLNASAAQVVKNGGAIGVLSNTAINGLNPMIQPGVATAVPGSQIFSSLLIADDKWEFHPYLATKWEKSGDGLSYTFYLNDKALFHDGKPVTAKDVAFSIQAAKEFHPFGKSIYANLKRIETPDDHTVVIELAKPSPTLLLAVSTPALLPILPEHIYGEHAGPLRSNPYNNKPIGSGPFKFEKYDPGRYLTLERFDDFFLGQPQLEKITIAIMNDRNAAALAIQRGEINYAPFPPLRLADIKRLGENPAIQLTTKGYEGVGALTWIEYNFKKEGPLQNKKVRQAIAYAIDKEFTTQQLQLGQTSPAYGPIHPSSPFYKSDLNKYELDIDKANQLLDDAGFAKGADGMRFDLTIDYVPSGPDLTKVVAEYLRPQLAKVGIRLQIRTSPDMPTWMRRVANYDYDLNIDQVFNWGDPVIGVSRSYMSSNIREGVPWANMSAYSNPKVDELLDAAAIENDEEQRKKLYFEFQDIVSDELPVTWLNTYPMNTISSADLANVPLGIWGPFTPIHEMGWKQK